MDLRVENESDSRCRFVRNHKRFFSKGTITALNKVMLKVVPKKNVKYLTSDNQKRWQKINNK